jgi:hypothetical protein
MGLERVAAFVVPHPRGAAGARNRLKAGLQTPAALTPVPIGRSLRPSRRFTYFGVAFSNRFFAFWTNSGFWPEFAIRSKGAATDWRTAGASFFNSFSETLRHAIAASFATASTSR